jgi:hypothetical protein
MKVCFNHLAIIVDFHGLKNLSTQLNMLHFHLQHNVQVFLEGHKICICNPNLLNKDLLGYI